MYQISLWNMQWDFPAYGERGNVVPSSTDHGPRNGGVASMMIFAFLLSEFFFEESQVGDFNTESNGPFEVLEGKVQAGG